MAEHNTFIIAAYTATAVILGWCALAPMMRASRIRARLASALSRAARHGGDKQ